MKPLLHQVVPEYRLQQLLPDVRVRYGGRTIIIQEDPYGFVEFMLRKTAHVFLYGALGTGLFLLFSRRWALSWSYAVALFLVVLVAIFDEWNQSGRWNRYGSVYDIGLDLAGASVFILITILFMRTAKR